MSGESYQETFERETQEELKAAKPPASLVRYNSVFSVVLKSTETQSWCAR